VLLPTFKTGELTPEKTLVPPFKTFVKLLVFTPYCHWYVNPVPDAPTVKVVPQPEHTTAFVGWVVTVAGLLTVNTDTSLVSTIEELVTIHLKE
jgi:hypothetical protein